MQLSRFCHSKLEEAERRVELLTERGEVKPAPPPSASIPARWTERGDQRASRPADMARCAETRGRYRARSIHSGGRHVVRLHRFMPASRRAPARVSESMRYSLFAGGKRLRPILALAAAEAVAEPLGGRKLRRSSWRCRSRARSS